MASLELTIQVLDLSPKVTLTDLYTFFSYCGTVDKILLERREDQTQLAIVTFRQSYALETALLLNDAIIVDHRVRILPLQNLVSLPISDNMNNETKNKEKRGLIPELQSAVQAMASRGYETVNRAKEELDDKYKLSEKGRALTQQTRMAISAVEQKAGHLGEVIVNNECFLAGALWLSGAFDKAAKCTTQLGSHNKRRAPNSRKQK